MMNSFDTAMIYLPLEKGHWKDGSRETRSRLVQSTPRSKMMMPGP